MGELMKAVQERWPTAAAFYAERDDRTVRLVRDLPQYASRQVEIVLDPREVDSPTGQRLLVTAANLTSRWARRVRIVSVDAELVPALRRDGSAGLRERVLKEMWLADPFGDFQWTTGFGAGGCGDTRPLRLVLGRGQGVPARTLQPDDFVVHATAWTAMGRRGGVLPGRFGAPAALPAAALAASLGVADLFKRAIGHPHTRWLPGFAWSTWSQQFIARPFDDVPWLDPQVDDTVPWSRMLIAGVGAIGSALAYFASLGSPEAGVCLLDRDHVEASNLNRSPLFTVEHVLRGMPKTEAVARYLAADGLRTTILSGTWDELTAAVRERRFECWVSLTNEAGAWAIVPFLQPPSVVHGTTTSGWGFGVGRHIPGLDDCTYCRMPRPKAEFRGPCATGDISSKPATQVRASLPFLSAASAAQALAELWKVRSAEVEQLPNDVSADLAYGLPGIVSLRRRAKRGCPGCRAAAVSRTGHALADRGPRDLDRSEAVLIAPPP
ncbi:MAG: hypothetical protein AMXMBFR53_09720 [Gemmatimonadota bacterium]